MRAEDEIVRAHDILWAIVMGEVDLQISKRTRRHIHTSLDLLCWVLEHDHNPAFFTNLAWIEQLAEDAGYRLIKMDESNP